MVISSLAPGSGPSAAAGSGVSSNSSGKKRFSKKPASRESRTKTTPKTRARKSTTEKEARLSKPVKKVRYVRVEVTETVGHSRSVGVAELDLL